MDALALLCTLHADGPTSLKRLRARGCVDLDALVARTPDDLADDLEVERAVARRFLREARILAERVGPSVLDPEEAPPAVGRSAPGEAPNLAAAPTAPAASELDAVDRQLVARISRPHEAATGPATEPEPVEEPAPPVEEARQVEVPAIEEGTEDVVAESVAEIAPEPFAVEPAAAESAAAEPAAAEFAAAEPTAAEQDAPAPFGFGAAVFATPVEEPAQDAPEPVVAQEDDALLAAESFLAESAVRVDVPDLSSESNAFGLGVTSIPAAAPAAPEVDLEVAPEEAEEPAEEEPVAEVLDAPELEELETGRIVADELPGLDEALVEDLERLGIETYDELSRAESLELTRGLGITFAQARRLRFLARRAAIEAVEHAELSAVQPAPPAAAPEPPSPAADVVPEPVISETLEPVVDAAPRPAFDRAPAVAESPTPDDEQGVRVDPSEIEARPRFGEQFARAAAERRARAEAAPAESDPAPAATSRTVLGWNFEIPRPEPDALPFASISAPAPADPVEAVDAAEQPARGPEEDTAGPFAHA